MPPLRELNSARAAVCLLMFRHVYYCSSAGASNAELTTLGDSFGVIALTNGTITNETAMAMHPNSAASFLAASKSFVSVVMIIITPMVTTPDSIPAHAPARVVRRL